MELPRLGVHLELLLPAYTTVTATAIWDLNLIFGQHYSSQQHRILNPVSEDRDRTCILRVTSQVWYQ